MKKHTHVKPTAPTTKIAPPSSSLDLLLPITSRELEAAHHQSTFATEEEAAQVAREFRASQPGIYAYLPYTASTPRGQAYENSLICAFARRLCVAFNARFGAVPVLQEEELRATEVHAQTLLADPVISERVQKLPAVRFAEGGILGVHTFEDTTVSPDRNRVLLKVLTLLLCFSAALRDRH